MFVKSSMTASRQERHKGGRYPTVNRLSPNEVRAVMAAVGNWNNEAARIGDGRVVDEAKLMRVLRG
jgi:hypothetical protein